MNVALRGSRPAALGILALALAAAWLLVIEPVAAFGMRHWREHREHVAEGNRLSQLLEQQSALEHAKQTVDADPVWQTLYKADSESGASAQLQADIQNIGQNAGVTLASMQPLPTLDFGPLQKVGARVSLSAPIDVLVRFLEQLKGSAHRVSVEDARIVAPQAQQPGANPMLNLEVQIYGVWWKGAK